MQTAHLLPDVITYSAATSACEEAQQWQRALGLLVEVQKAHLLPNVFTYSAPISTCEKARQWHQAPSLLAAMQEADLVAKFYHLQRCHQCL